MTIITIYELIRKDLTLFYPQKFVSYGSTPLPPSLHTTVCLMFNIPLKSDSI
jgi:hypothetical protein